jgi:hypothetical protein
LKGQLTEACTIDQTHRKNYPVVEKSDRTKLGPDCIDKLAGLWCKFGKNGEAKSRMIKVFVSSIRPKGARIRPMGVNMEAPMSLKV